MLAITTSEYRRRLQAYTDNPHANDTELARILGMDVRRFNEWRNRQGLPARQSILTRGVRMEDALTPEQCDTMRAFLRTLLAYGSKGSKPDVLEFAREWGQEWERREIA